MSELIVDCFKTLHTLPVRVILVPTLVWLTIWLLGVKQYAEVNKKNVESWKKLPEFPIINHARFMTTYFYTIFLVVNTMILSFFVIGSFFVETVSIFILIVNYGFLIFNIIFLYILTLFSKIYHVLISVTVIEDSLEKSQESSPNDYEIGKKQIAEKLWIQYLYRFLLFCDVIGFPVALYHDSKVETKLGEFYYTKVYVAVFHNVFYALVPLAGVFHLVMKYKKRGNQRASGTLKKLILLQLYIISFLQIIFLTASGVSMVVLDSTFILPNCVSLILPIIIQRTTIFISRKQQRDRRIRPDAYSIELESV